MTLDLSLASLLRLLHSYYPTGVRCDDPEYKASAEARRLTQFLEDAQKDTRAWKAFVQRVREEFPDCTFWDSTLLFYDPCYRLRVSLPVPARQEDRSDEVVCLISLLAPAYVIYASHSLNTGPFAEAWTRYPPLPPEFQPYEARLAAIIESTFGSTRLPNEVIFTPVPDLDVRAGNIHLGKARLIDLLFTEDRW
jgi:hypothetical protein